MEGRYALICDSLCKVYEDRGYIPLSLQEVRREIQTLPGISFPEGTTFEEVLETLVDSGLVVRINENGFVPLSRKSSRKRVSGATFK
jgi:hypothetical protein